jgi:hypothetical protein
MCIPVLLDANSEEPFVIFNDETTGYDQREVIPYIGFEMAYLNLFVLLRIKCVSKN